MIKILVGLAIGLMLGIGLLVWWLKRGGVGV